MNRGRLACAFVFALALSCQGGEDVTEIVLEVTSEVLPPQIDQIAFRVIGPAGSEKASRSFPVSSAEALPLRLGLLHESGPLGVYDVRVAGLLANEVVVSDARSVSFEHGRSQVERFRLADPGGQGGMAGGAGGMGMGAGGMGAGGVGGGTGGADMGGRGGAGGTTPDAGTGGMPPRPPDAGPDAFVCPSGCVCEQRGCGNGGQGCTCNAGCPCTLACVPGTNCQTRCSGAANCDIAAAGSTGVSVDCDPRSACRVVARSASNVNVTCKAADCSIDCEDAGTCRLSCADGAACLLRCGGAGTCQLRDCPGARSCPGNIQVCGRACP